MKLTELLMGALLYAPCSAQEVGENYIFKLNTGDSITGTLLRKYDKAYKIEVPYGEMILTKDRVRGIYDMTGKCISGEGDEPKKNITFEEIFADKELLSKSKCYFFTEDLSDEGYDKESFVLRSRVSYDKDRLHTSFRVDTSGGTTEFSTLDDLLVSKFDKKVKEFAERISGFNNLLFDYELVPYSDFDATCSDVNEKDKIFFKAYGNLPQFFLKTDKAFANLDVSGKDPKQIIDNICNFLHSNINYDSSHTHTDEIFADRDIPCDISKLLESKNLINCLDIAYGFIQLFNAAKKNNEAVSNCVALPFVYHYYDNSKNVVAHAGVIVVNTHTGEFTFINPGNKSPGDLSGKSIIRRD